MTAARPAPTLPEGLRVVDSITQLTPADAGAVVVSGSHGGRSSAGYALAQPLAFAAFNDAGVGKDDAGIVALALLQDAGVPAVAVAHGSARIGDAADTLANGVVSHANAAARAIGVVPGQPLRRAVDLALARRAAGPAG